MSKSNDSSKLGPATQVRELRDDELENVSGGVTIDFCKTARVSGLATSEVFELNT